MCGIAGVLKGPDMCPPDFQLMETMLSLIRHRGPDESGIYFDDTLAMGSVRLSIIDLKTGQQPISNEDGSIWIVFNGEIFNYVELIAELKDRGHKFRTASDTETIIHLYEEMGPACLERLNGQFAFALWDRRKSELMLGRDRVGIQPLFYSKTGDTLVFASEIKAILAHPNIVGHIDSVAIDQILTFWAPLSPRTGFSQIYELPPAHYMIAGKNRMEIRPYWELNFHPKRACKNRSTAEAVEEFMALFEDSIRLRLRADVPVGAYLSGGLDSSTTVDCILQCTKSDLRTFSIGFTDKLYDETPYQEIAIEHLKTAHCRIFCSYSDIGREFPQAIWHAEIPILRTAPVPMYILSGLVRENGIKTVVTGEGADEMLAGYNIFKEALIRRFWARQPESKIRPLLLNKLYPYLIQMQNAGSPALRSFFGDHLTEISDPIYSHILRWQNTSRTKQFLSRAFKDEIKNYDPIEDIREQTRIKFKDWPLLSRAQYLESSIFMSGYLLSSQADRMAMGHSVEGRYPFLDHRLIEFCAELPPTLKLRGLKEKFLLKQAMKDRLPQALVDRSKHPYRAPISRCFFNKQQPEYVPELLSESAISETGFFAHKAVAKLQRKAESGAALSETEGMALVGILSTQLVHKQFIKDFRNRTSQPIQRASRIICGKIDRHTAA